MLIYMLLWPIVVVAVMSIVVGLCVKSLDTLSGLYGKMDAFLSNVALVIAHPDDESMFFVPTLSALVKQGRAKIHILCLSEGGEGAIARTRTSERHRAASILGVPAPLVHVVARDGLRDGMDQKWDLLIVQKEVMKFVKKHQIDTIITFDGRGVSSHPNHIATFHGVRNFLDSKRFPNIRAFSLRSTFILRKYISIFDALQTLREVSRTRKDTNNVVA
eukprot:204053_1